jgi:hypothetical protein
MTGKIGGLGLLLLGLFIGGSFLFQLTSTPSRTQSARLDPFGEINVHLQTDPDPPKPGGIPLMIDITDANGKPVAVDKVEYDYWSKDQAAQVLAGESTGVGSFSTVAGIGSVGEWQVQVTLFKGTQQTQVKFTLRVMPNI